MQPLSTAILITTLVAAPAAADLAEGVARYEAGDIPAAQKIFSAMTTAEPGNAAAFYQLGITQMSLNELEPAIESFERAVELNDDVSDYHRRLGEAQGSLAGQVGALKQMRLASKIHKSFARAVELDGKNIDARFGLLTFYLQAPGIAGGSSSKAAEQAEAINKLDAGRGHMAYAAVYSDAEEHGKAEQAYRDAMAAAPEDQDPILALGITLTAQARYAEAVEIYEDWLKHMPDDMSIAYQLGRTASIAGEFLEPGRAALETYVDGYQPKPDEPSIAWGNYRLGLIYQHLGEIDLARSAFQTALADDPKHKQAKKALRELP